jgi:hypothetical protein
MKKCPKAIAEWSSFVTMLGQTIKGEAVALVRIDVDQGRCAEEL